MQPTIPPARASLVGRALLGALLTIGFYGLALTIAACLLLFVYTSLVSARYINVQLVLICLVAAFVIVWSIIPRRDRFVPPGPRLTPHEHPRLFAEVEAIAKLANQPMPREIYLTADVNAGVTERGGIMGIGSRRVMLVGLPLLQALTVSQLRGVLAHEFGHFYGGDTRLGPWIYKTRGTIGRTIGNLNGFLAIPFHWYARLFLRITNAISRRQEFVADALAARIVGAQTYAGGLRSIYRVAPAFERYMRQEYLPAVERGYCPPFLEGFERFNRVAGVSDAMQRFVAEEAYNARADAYDTHPSLGERLAALAAHRSPEAPSDVRPAITLLGDVAAVEAAVLRNLVRSGSRQNLRPVSWDEIGVVAYLPEWEEVVRTYAAGLTGHTIGTLPELVRAPGPLVAEILRRNRGAIVPQEIDNAVRAVAGTALAVALGRAGWTVDAAPGTPVTVRKGQDVVEPFAVPNLLAEGKLTGDEWVRRSTKLGIASLELHRT